MKIERRIPSGAKEFDPQADGELGPLVFKPNRASQDEYEVTIDYNSGIMGTVKGHQRIQYVPPQKKPVAKRG